MKNELRGIGILLFAILVNTIVSPVFLIALPIGIVGLFILFKNDSH